MFNFVLFLPPKKKKYIYENNFSFLSTFAFSFPLIQPISSSIPLQHDHGVNKMSSMFIIKQMWLYFSPYFKIDYILYVYMIIRYQTFMIKMKLV